MAESRLWAAPAMERREFASWDEFFAYIEEYQQRTHQTFSRRSATSVKTRNQVLKSAAHAGRAMSSQLLPESFLDYTRMLQCAHKLRGEAARASARWNGEQPSECQARVNATLQLCRDGRYRIRVTKVNLQHTHPLAASGSFITSVSAQHRAATSAGMEQGQGTKRRRVGRPPTNPSAYAVSEANARQAEAGATPRVPTMADVRNFLDRVKRTRSLQPGALQSVEERLAAYVNEFAGQEGNAAKIFVDDQKVLSSITLQTRHMRKVFEAFPEVLRVDAMPAPKEESSDSNYRVFSLMAHDTFGNWQYVQHAIVESDRSQTLSVALDQFKANNARHPRVRALVVPDGDLPELEGLHANFPAARVLYSQFHVVRALHKAIAEHGKDLTSWHRDRLTGIAQLLVYAPTSVVYGGNIAMMVEVLGSKQHSFFRYFLEKWDSCRDRWTTFAREGVTTFGMSETGDQFAPTWQAIFAAANNEMALDETVAAIRYFQAVVERAFIQDLDHAVSNGAARHDDNNEYDAEMRLLAAAVSPAVSSLVFPQYRYAIARGAYQFCEPSRGSFFVSAVSPNDIFCDEPSKEFCVEADRGWQCSCAFMVNHHLPCRHVFYIRRIVHCGCVIPMENIESRWVLTKAKYFFESPHSVEAAADEVGLEREADRRHAVATPGSWQKFISAQQVGKRISQRMMEMEPDEFDRALQFYKLVETTMNVRPFDLNSAIVARLNIQDGGLAAGRSVQRPNWVEPDPTRRLAPRGGLQVAGGAMYVSAHDYMLAAAAGMDARPTRSQAAPAVPLAPQPAGVIDLQDESEEEEKGDSVQDNESARADQAATASNEEPSSSSGQDHSSTEKEDDMAEESFLVNPDGEKEAVTSSNNNDDSDNDNDAPEQSSVHNEEPADAPLQHPKSSPTAAIESWEVIDGPVKETAATPPSPAFNNS